MKLDKNIFYEIIDEASSRFSNEYDDLFKIEYSQIINYISQSGLKVEKVSFVDKRKAGRVKFSKDNIVEVSSLTLFASSIENMKDIGIDNIEFNSFHSDWKFTSSVLNLWSELMVRRKYPDCFYEPMILNILSYEAFLLGIMLKKCKKIFLQWMLKTCKITPKFVYKDGLKRRYYLIFENSTELEYFKLEDLDKANDGLQKILKLHDPYNHYNINRASLELYHLEMEDVNFYGMSREDY